ncbi:AraC-type DNA-binding protein [Roseateles sp. YR242]|uniref:AraC family transcriptional regulator n=1 Tax=Roseateles sp. YR242 TaxID=1855305 RepID=UPI0008CE4D48|nr:AraC family transcriptional regulator [Roseateles sp. YR242]SEK82496.1 AraC-type DNA-binding protein [Roseateles sp. YR242]
MTDPLAEVVSLLRPSAPFSKLVVASAPWAVRRSEIGRPFYFVVLEGGCRLKVDGPGAGEALTLEAGDFVLIPASRGFATSSLDREPPSEGESVTTPIAAMSGGARVGDPHGLVDLRMLVGNCELGSPDAALLVSLLPQWIHVRGDRRLASLVQLVADESRANRPAREIVTARLLEVMLIEAFRSSASSASTPGLVSGLADPKLAQALRCMHERPAQPWTVQRLAAEAAMSRSAFFERFGRIVGMAPTEYLLAWRMALAKQMLLQQALPMATIAERVGYSSVSAFGVAFTRQVGAPPGRFVKQWQDTHA